MITIERDNSRFNYRVAGVVLHDGKVLIHRGENEDFWTLPGGRCQMYERGAHALRREMAEELDLIFRWYRWTGSMSFASIPAFFPLA